LDKIYFKNGYYKIVDFSIFLSDKKKNEEANNFLCLSKVKIDDVFAFGMLYLKLLLGTNKFNNIMQSISQQSLMNE
jgi:hypothetical protein